MTEIREVWVASFTYGKGNLSKALVVKETEKNFVIERNPEKILGWQWLPARLSKKSGRVYLTPEEAMDYLVRAAQEHIAACEEAVVNAVKQHSELVRLRKRL